MLLLLRLWLLLLLALGLQSTLKTGGLRKSFLSHLSESFGVLLTKDMLRAVAKQLLAKARNRSISLITQLRPHCIGERRTASMALPAELCGKRVGVIWVPETPNAPLRSKNALGAFSKVRRWDA